MSEMARITLADISLVGHHGHHAAEQELGQRFEVDVELWVDIEKPGRSDKLSDAVDYQAVYARVAKVVREDRFSLLEALATDLADTILRDFPVRGVVLRIRKPNVPSCPNVGYVEVEVPRGDVGE
jgi:dihydroneopterin aldolase